MVNINFPARLTDEEEKLRQKYALLRKKKKILQALKTAKPEREPVAQQPAKRPAPESAEDAKEQAKKLLKSGAIRIASDSGDKHSFKRSKYLEKKLKDPEKTPLAVGFQPFQATHPEDEEREPRPRQKMRLYDNFVSGGFGEKKEREIRGKETPLRGNTIYVHGHGVSEEILRKAFSNLGTVINVNMEKDKNVGFVTFEKMESADSAISEVNNAMIDGVQLRVSMARRQPTFEQSADPSTTSWSSIAASSSQKGSHKDKRAMVTYEEQDMTVNSIDGQRFRRNDSVDSSTPVNSLQGVTAMYSIIYLIEDAKEQAKKLLKSGAIRIASDSGDKHSFKRSKYLEKKLKDPEKTPLAVGFQPFQATHPEDEEREPRPRQKMRLYDNFVSGGFGEKKEREIRGKETPLRGNTIYVHGHGVSEEILRKAFSNLGTVINVNMEKDKNVGFVTFEKMESADSAISEVNNAMIDGVQLRVSMARRQPTFEQSADPSTTSWSSIAASSSQKGSHKDKRAMVTYEEQDMF